MSDASGGARRVDPNDRAGLAMAIGGACGLGLAVAVSRFAYEGGTNGLTVAVTRALLAVLVLGAVCVITGRRLRIARHDYLHCVGLGLLMSMMFYGNVGSVEFIPVGLAALIFYTYPPMVGILHVIVYRERPSLTKVVALACAFGGLCLMLGVSFADTDPRGMLLALSAGVCTAWNAVWLARRVPHLDPVVVTFHMTTGGAAVLVIVAFAVDGLTAPTSSAGWLGLAGVALLQTSAMPLYFAAIPRIGPLKSAMISNVQPVTSILAAYILFAEVLTAIQLAGGVAVLVGVCLMQLQDSRRRLGPA